jgi:hypothetical protein
MDKIIKEIEKRRARGMSDDAIAGQLWEEGYDTKAITKAMDTIGPPVAKVARPSTKLPSLLFLGVAFGIIWYTATRK